MAGGDLGRRGPSLGQGETTETLGTRLRQFRRGGGMSKSMLARKSGIPKTRLSQYENDRISPSLRNLGRLAQALNVVEGLLLGSEDRPTREFIRVLRERGVSFGNEASATQLAHSVADMLQGLERGGVDAATD